MLQAMNTGHDGSLSTIHSNTPRDALARVETMVLMAGYDLPVRAIREQVSSALECIIHLERLEDGSRRVTSITEVQGMESDVITLQELFKFQIDEVTRDGDDRRRPAGHGTPADVPPEVREARHRAAARPLPGSRAGAGRRCRRRDDREPVKRLPLIVAVAFAAARRHGDGGRRRGRHCSVVAGEGPAVPGSDVRALAARAARR